MKIDTNNLYVACRVYDIETLIEPWIQYESFGKVDHKIIVVQKKSIVVKIEDSNGNEKYYDFRTFNEVFVKNYNSSYESESSCGNTCFLSGWPLGPLKDQAIRYFQNKGKEIAYLMPLKEYIKNKLGIEIEDYVSKTKLLFIINFLNLRYGKPFELSYDEDTAEKQINKKVKKLSK